MSLFSLIFALLLALAFIVFLLFFTEVENRRTPVPAAPEEAVVSALRLPQTSAAGAVLRSLVDRPNPPA